MRTPVEKLDWDMKVTAGSRFNASRRLRRSYRRKQWFAIIFSIFIVFVSALTLVFEFTPLYTKILGFVALASSIFVVVFSASQIENTDAVNAHRVYQSAVEISALRREFTALTPQDQQVELSRFVTLYNTAIAAHGINHEDEDFVKYKLSHWWEFDDLKDKGKPAIASAKLFEWLERESGPVAVWTSATALAGALAASIASLIG